MENFNNVETYQATLAIIVGVVTVVNGDQKKMKTKRRK
jgi:hypothetical protein